MTRQLKAQFGEHMFDIPIAMNTSIQRAELMDQTTFAYDSNCVASKSISRTGNRIDLRP
jgi:hypothetical protein